MGEVPSHPSFLPCHAQGIALDMEMQATRVDTWSEGLDVHRLCIFIEIDQSGNAGLPGQAKTPAWADGTLREPFSSVTRVDFPTQRFQK